MKSDGTKNKIAIIFATSITLIIVGLWFLLIRQKDVDDTAKVESSRDDLKPLFMIFKGAKDDFTEIKTDIKEQKSSTQSADSTSDVVVE
jgi:hypothetical protein